MPANPEANRTKPDNSVATGNLVRAANSRRKTASLGKVVELVKAASPVEVVRLVKPAARPEVKVV